MAADARGVAPAPPDDLEPIRQRWVTPDYGMTHMEFSVAASSPISAHDLGKIAKADIAFLIAGAEAFASALSAARSRAADLEQELRDLHAKWNEERERTMKLCLEWEAELEDVHRTRLRSHVTEAERVCEFVDLLNPIEQASLEMKLRVTMWMVYHKLDKEGAWALATARRQC